MEEINYLSLYAGDEIVINDYLSIHIPLLSEIKKYGEKKYYSLITSICSCPSDLKWQLYDIGIDFTEVSEYDNFISNIAPTLKKEDMSIIFKTNFNFSRCQIEYDDKLKMNILVYYDTKELPDEISETRRKKLIKKKLPLPTHMEENKYIFDLYTYDEVTKYLRILHSLKKTEDKPVNEFTKMMMIELAREDYRQYMDKPYEPFLFPLISSMVNREGFKRNETDVFNMNIFAFMDSVKRIMKIKNADLLLASSYSGFGVNLKDVKNEVEWTDNLY